MSYQLKKYRGSYVAYQCVDNKVLRKSLGTKDYEEAQRRFADFLELENSGDGFINGILNYWIQEKRGIASHETSCMVIEKHLRPFFKSYRPDQITKAKCREYIDLKRKEGLSDWSIRRQITILKGACNLHDKYTPARFEMPPEGLPRDRVLTKEEFLKVLEACETPHIRLFLILAITTAGRMSAILELTWDRVDFERGFIKLATTEHVIKGRATIPINKRCREALEEAFELRTTNHVIEYNGAPIRNVKTAFRGISRKTGIKITAHVLRHTAAVWMVRARIPLETVSKYLGHTSTKVTYKHYAHHSPDYLAEAAEALEF